MDSAELSNFAKMRFNQSLAKKNLDAKIESILTLTYGGGLFNIDYSLISFVNTMHQNIIGKIKGFFKCCLFIGYFE